MYIALGDSLAVGVGASSPATSYVGRLFTHYQSTLGVTDLLTVAQSGTSSGGITGQVASAVARINASSDTKVVTIDIGGVDVLGSSTFGSDPSTTSFKNNFSSALSQIQTALASDTGGGIVIAMLYPNPYRGEGAPREATWDDRTLGDSKHLNCADTGDEIGLDDAISQVASANSTLVANPIPAFDIGEQSFISGDDLHPNDDGYQAIFDAFVAAGAAC